MEIFGVTISPAVIWFIIGIILFLLEMTAPGIFFLFFALGAIIVGIICLFADGLSLEWQLLIFSASSVIMLLTLRRYVRKLFSGFSESGDTEKKYDEFVGETVTVVEPIHPPKIGKVELHGSLWKAESDEPIGKGELVEVTGKKNITLFVKPK
jgi:membrane protein implicated in regulation of membrane protease activity